jgi:Mor family transcriptional regulator
MNRHLPKPFDAEAYCRTAAERRRRLMSPANAFKAPKAVPALTVVHRAPERPLWKMQAISFDAHVLAYQWRRANTKGNIAQEYIKQRCVELGANYVKVTTKGRTTRDITGHRQLLMYELKTKFHLSYPRIGREFGCDHSTALHAVARIAKIRGEDKPEFVSGTDRLLGDQVLKQEIKDDYLCGMSIEDLAEKFAISEVAIVTVAKMENWHKPHRQFLKGKPFKPVSVDLVTMQCDYESGLLLRELVVKHQVSETTIRRIRDRHGWKRGSAE